LRVSAQRVSRFSVGQPEMAPQSEPGEGSHNNQERMSPSREDSMLGTCSGHEAPRPEEGAHTEEAQGPGRGGQACAPQKAEPMGSCPGESFHLSRPPGAQAEGTGALSTPSCYWNEAATPGPSNLGRISPLGNSKHR
uniref:Uncharacterized protein n=1 Tax=Neovison vison TaxID=452646 RepID=A0A8C7EKF8_NEOVI